LDHIERRRQENMPRLVRSFAASLLIAALLTPSSHAQPFPESNRQKAEEERKKAEEKATDEAYKATLKHTQDVKKSVDPWGSLRTTPPGSNK
jgi:ribosomal protein L9